MHSNDHGVCAAPASLVLIPCCGSRCSSYVVASWVVLVPSTAHLVTKTRLATRRSGCRSASRPPFSITSCTTGRVGDALHSKRAIIVVDDKGSSIVAVADMTGVLTWLLCCLLLADPPLSRPIILVVMASWRPWSNANETSLLRTSLILLGSVVASYSWK